MAIETFRKIGIDIQARIEELDNPEENLSPLASLDIESRKHELMTLSAMSRNKGLRGAVPYFCARLAELKEDVRMGLVPLKHLAAEARLHELQAWEKRIQEAMGNTVTGIRAKVGKKERSHSSTSIDQMAFE